MNLPVGEKPQSVAVSGAARVITEISLGLSSYKKAESGHGVTQVTVYTETSDFTAQSFTDIVVTSGSGLLVYKDSDGIIQGRQVLETGDTASLATGVHYSYWADYRSSNEVFKILEYCRLGQVTSETPQDVDDLQL